MNKKQRFVMGILLGSMWMSNIQSMEGGKEERKEIVPYAPAAPKEPIAAFGLPADLVKYIMKFLSAEDLLALAKIIEQEALRTISKEGKPQLRLEAPGTMKEIGKQAVEDLRKEEEWLNKFDTSLPVFETEKLFNELVEEAKRNKGFKGYENVINAQNKAGETALIRATKMFAKLLSGDKGPYRLSASRLDEAIERYSELIFLLFDSGADGLIADKAGNTYINYIPEGLEGSKRWRERFMGTDYKGKTGYKET